MANNFASDSDFIAHFRFESGALTTDSIGGNTLVATGSPTVDTVNFKEGAGAVDLEKGTPDFYTVDDASLDAGFPCKAAGGTTTFSIALWFKAESIASVGHICSKYNAFGNTRNFFILLNNADSKVQIAWGFNGGASATGYVIDQVITVGEWVHVAATWDDGNDAITARLYDEADSSTTDLSDTNANALATVASQFSIGASGDVTARLPFDGIIDDVVIAKRVLSDGDIDLIRQGLYGPGGRRLVDGGGGINSKLLVGRI